MVRKIVLSAAVAMLMVPAFASAQSTVNATATVGKTATVTGTGDVAFGTLSAVTDNTISATGGATTRTVTYNNNITVSFSSVPTALTSPGLTALPVSLTCASRIGAGSWSAASACSSASFDLDVGAALTTGTLGFGGTVLAADVANAAAGDYTGSFTIVVVSR
jgi:hypothetical protein